MEGSARKDGASRRTRARECARSVLPGSRTMTARANLEGYHDNPRDITAA